MATSPRSCFSSLEIPIWEWPTILRRIEQNEEPLRHIARDYGVSYEAVRRVVKAARFQDALSNGQRDDDSPLAHAVMIIVSLQRPLNPLG